MAASLWRAKERDNVVVATHDDPATSFLSDAGLHELSRLIDEWQRRSVRAVVVTLASEGRLIAQRAVEERPENEDGRESRFPGVRQQDYHRLLRRLNGLDKPVIAAMTGATTGARLELALACDIRIAQRGAFRYGLPEVRLRALPSGNGAARLSRMIGVANTLVFCTRGRLVSPDLALELGLVDELVDDARGHAEHIARQLATLPPVAVATIKAAVRAASDRRLAGIHAAFVNRHVEGAGRTTEPCLAVPLDRRRDRLEDGSLPNLTGGQGTA